MNNITLSNDEKLYISSLVRQHKKEETKAQAETKTSLIKFFIKKNMMSDDEIKQIEHMVFETKVLRPNLIPTEKIHEIINSKLRLLEMSEL